MPIKIHNVRLHHAANSSSSHSVFILKNKNARTLKRPEFFNDTPDDDSYGWEHFWLNSPDQKLKYLASQIYYALPETMDDGQKVNFLNQLLNYDVPTYDQHIYTKVGAEYESILTSRPAYIDHQSIWGLGFLDFTKDDAPETIKFLQELKEMMLRDDIVIAGGNDNSDLGIDTSNEDEMNGYGIDKEYSFFNNHVYDDDTVIKVRKDDANGMWTLYNRDTGAKLRFSFEEPFNLNPFQDWQSYKEKSVASFYKAPWPELVDMKITDYCNFGCNFCYTDSTEEGKHGKLEDIKKYIDTLAEGNIFEIAFGGGETTLHPDLEEILRYTKSKGIVPSLTSKNLKFFKSDLFWELFNKKIIGSVAYSVTNKSQITKLHEILNDKREYSSYGDGSRIHIHIVMGVQTMANTLKMIEESSSHWFTTTLLGFKTNGRGETFKPHDYTDWINVIKNHNFGGMRVNICIDTILASQSNLNQIYDVDDITYHLKDGGISAYIDSVNNKIARSSYEINNIFDFKPDSTKDDFISIWETFKDE